MKYPERVMQILRQRDGLDKDDTSEDDALNALSQKQALSELVAWELGSPDWAWWFINQVESVGGSVKFE